MYWEVDLRHKEEVYFLSVEQESLVPRFLLLFYGEKITMEQSTIVIVNCDNTMRNL